MWCHLLLALPVLGLGLFLILPLPLALPLYVAVDLFSLWLYRRVMEAMRESVQVGTEALRGAKAKVLRAPVLRQQGLVRIGGEVWQARSEQPVSAGETVKVVAVRGLCLWVAPDAGRGSG